MKSWKEQLRGIKTALRGSGGNKKGGDKPSAVEFEPPESWSTGNRAIPKGGGGPRKDTDSDRITPPKANDRKIGRKHRSDPTSRNSDQRATVSGTVGSSDDKPSLRSDRTAPPIFKPLVNGGSSLVMPEWSAAGRSLQHPEHRGERSPPMTVRVGVDFGTAFTKVAIRAGADLVPVEWSEVTGDDSETGRYIVPGFVVRSPDGEYCWQRIKGSDIQGNLKLSVIEKAESDECPISTVAYLALVIRYARAFLYRNTEVGRKLAGRSLRWELNIGCPTEPHEKPEVVDMFRRIARTAWRLATRINLQESDIKAAWVADESDTGLETEPGVVPEFVAHIAGYLASPQVKEGLHALIDIGAATLDVATFNVVLQNEQTSPPRIPIFFSAVRPLGTHYLHYNRHSKLDLELSWNDAALVESAGEFGERNGKASEDVIAVDGEFAEQIERCVTGVINGTRINSRGDPRSRAWREGLPIFVTGGGSSCDLYRQAMVAVEAELKLRVEKRSGSSRHFRFIELSPTFGSARRIDTGGRLTVALGLTEDAENIARVVPHRDIGPITYGTKASVDHSDLYGD